MCKNYAPQHPDKSISRFFCEGNIVMSTIAEQVMEHRCEGCPWMEEEHDKKKDYHWKCKYYKKPCDEIKLCDVRRDEPPARKVAEKQISLKSFLGGD